MVVIWFVADAVQRAVPVSLAWAILDEIGHAAVAVACAAWLVPSWGYGPVIVAIMGATAIDVDHAVVARSLAPGRMMSLGARPMSHSLAGALTIALCVGLVGGPRRGYAAALGTVTHVLGDARAFPGVPLLFPALANAHVILPSWSLWAATIVLAAVNAAIARLGDARGSCGPRARHPTAARPRRREVAD
jgi:membrane-bound metal-dependent hydrolase YbcI (DUF457 family)